MKDLVGKKFGRLTVLERAGTTKWGNILWLCKCDCGKEHIAASGKLIQGKVTSCGCYAHEVHVKQLERHGITTGGKPRTLVIWCGMKARCLNKKSISYKSYGGRGITVCEEWLTFENFHKWALANGYDDGLTIDRIDNNGNYEPSNCQWITSRANKKRQRNARNIEICGVTKNLSEWCKELHIGKATAYKHLIISEDDFITFAKGQVYFINKFMEGQGAKSKFSAKAENRLQGVDC